MNASRETPIYVPYVPITSPHLGPGPLRASRGQRKSHPNTTQKKKTRLFTPTERMYGAVYSTGKRKTRRASCAELYCTKLGGLHHAHPSFADSSSYSMMCYIVALLEFSLPRRSYDVCGHLDPQPQPDQGRSVHGESL